MKLIIERISEIRSAQRANASAVAIECDMTEGQMYDAVLSFLEHISGETWTKWCEEIAGQDHPFSCLQQNAGIEAAEHQPVAVVRIHMTGGNAGLAWSGKPLDGSPPVRDGDLLYLAQPNQTERIKDDVHG